jgi:MerR family transcriptional regulator, heat shock protein HspR
VSDDRKPRKGAKAEVQAAFDEQRGVFMISVAAELAEMHPQTLRMYEARGLISPKRSPKNTRLYSFEDVERLRRIQRMTAQEGLNLAGVETVLELERQLARARVELGRMRDRATQLERQMLAEIERVKRSFRAEIVPYGAYDAEEIVPSASKPVQIRVQRPGRKPQREGS